MSEEGAGICYCKLPENVERNENALAEAIEAYSEMIKKQEMDLHCLKETGPCDPIDHNRCSSVSNAKESLSLAYNERGQLKYLLVDFHGAVQDYSMAIELVRENATSLYNRGQIYYRLGTDIEKRICISKHIGFCWISEHSLAGGRCLFMLVCSANISAFLYMNKLQRLKQISSMKLFSINLF